MNDTYKSIDKLLTKMSIVENSLKDRYAILDILKNDMEQVYDEERLIVEGLNEVREKTRNIKKKEPYVDHLAYFRKKKEDSINLKKKKDHLVNEINKLLEEIKKLNEEQPKNSESLNKFFDLISNDNSTTRHGYGKTKRKKRKNKKVKTSRKK